MNHFSRLGIAVAMLPRSSTHVARVGLVLTILLAACGGPVSESAEHRDDSTWSAHYRATLIPSQQAVDVVLDVVQPRALLREMRFTLDESIAARGNGEIVRTGNELTWLPPASGGRLEWRVTVANRRGDSGYDAWLDLEWGVFRVEDIIPRATTRTLKGATADTRLSFTLPPRWSVVTEYFERDGYFSIDKADRRFAQPSGWVVAGELGVRRERIAGVRVAVAAPQSEQVRRMDMLALLNWTLPELARVVPDMPARLTIVSAGEPMWRGGLSAPQSIYMHADRPLISENGTSTLLHEVMHVAIDIDAATGYDWIVEGFAEFYSLELLRRSGTISPGRYDAAMSQLKEWSASATRLCRRSSTGATTALAVVTLRNVDGELEKATDGAARLDDLVQSLSGRSDAIDLDALQQAFEQIAGRKSDTLHTDELPGCSKLAANRQGDSD